MENISESVSMQICWQNRLGKPSIHKNVRKEKKVLKTVARVFVELSLNFFFYKSKKIKTHPSFSSRLETLWRLTWSSSI